jgi:hypothetical protein
MVAPKRSRNGILGLLHSPIIVRAARVGDAESIAAMACAARAEVLRGPTDRSSALAEVAAEAAALMSGDDTFYLVATRLSVPIGFVRCRCAGSQWLVDQTFVSSLHRDEGVLPLLLSEVDRRAGAFGEHAPAVAIALDAA